MGLSPDDGCAVRASEGEGELNDGTEVGIGFKVTDGARVSNSDGESDGSADDKGDGSGDGDIDEALVRISDGESDGGDEALVGTRDGERGEREEALVGTGDGESDGSDEALVGFSDGEGDGSAGVIVGAATDGPLGMPVISGALGCCVGGVDGPAVIVGEGEGSGISDGELVSSLVGLGVAATDGASLG